MIRAAALLASLLIAGSARAEEPAPVPESTAPVAEAAPVTEAAPPAVPEAESPLHLEVTSAARSTGKTGLLLAAIARNTGPEDLLLLLSEAHAVPPDSMESACAPDSPRFRTVPVLQIHRTAGAGAEACGDTERVPKSDWALSVVRLPSGGAATIVVQMNGSLDWEGPLFARLGVSWTLASAATAQELKRAENLGLGFMVAAELPGGRIVGVGEGGRRIRRAVELFSERTVSEPVKIEGTLGG